MAKAHCDKLYELNITCNKEGELTKKTGSKNSYVFLLPDETNDCSLAMTSSFSSMLLVGLLIMNIQEIGQMAWVISKVQELGNYLLTECLPTLKKIAEMDFERVVFLGSGPLFGIAHESHLKVQEMSDGKVICKYDYSIPFPGGTEGDNRKGIMKGMYSVCPANTDVLEACFKQAKTDGRIVLIESTSNENTLNVSIAFPTD